MTSTNVVKSTLGTFDEMVDGEVAVLVTCTSGIFDGCADEEVATTFVVTSTVVVATGTDRLDRLVDAELATVHEI